LVTSDNLYEFLPDLPKEATKAKDIEAPDRNSIVHKCDIVRCLLLEKYGGLYIDADAVVLRDLTQILELLRQWEFVGIRRTSVIGQHIPVGIYASRAGGKVITAYANQLRQKIAEQTHFTWAELGAPILTPIVNSNLETSYLLPEKMIFPIGPERYELLLSDDEPIARYLSSNPIVFMLFNRFLEEEIGHWSEDRLMNSDILLSKLLRHALTSRKERSRMSSCLRALRNWLSAGQP
jgi:hypothetical protein